MGQQDDAGNDDGYDGATVTVGLAPGEDPKMVWQDPETIELYRVTGGRSEAALVQNYLRNRQRCFAALGAVRMCLEGGQARQKLKIARTQYDLFHHAVERLILYWADFQPRVYLSPTISVGRTEKLRAATCCAPGTPRGLVKGSVDEVLERVWSIQQHLHRQISVVEHGMSEVGFARQYYRQGYPWPCEDSRASWDGPMCDAVALEDRLETSWCKLVDKWKRVVVIERVPRSAFEEQAADCFATTARRRGEMH